MDICATEPWYILLGVVCANTVFTILRLRTAISWRRAHIFSLACHAFVIAMICIYLWGYMLVGIIF